MSTHVLIGCPFCGQPIAISATFCPAPVWSPDGRRLVHVRPAVDVHLCTESGVDPVHTSG